MKRKRSFIHTFVPVLTGFMTLYLVLMGISTFLIEDKFMESFETNYNTAVTEVRQTICKTEIEKNWIVQEIPKTPPHAITLY